VPWSLCGIFVSYKLCGILSTWVNLSEKYLAIGRCPIAFLLCAVWVSHCPVCRKHEISGNLYRQGYTQPDGRPLPIRHILFEILIAKHRYRIRIKECYHSIMNNETACPSRGLEMTSSPFSTFIFLGPSINFNRLDCSSVAYCSLLTT